MTKDVAAPEVPGEAAPLTTVDAPAAPASVSTSEAPALTTEQVAEFLGTNPDTLKSYQDFVNNNGGWDKSLESYKKAISGRQIDATPQAQVVTPSPLNDSAIQGTSVAPQPEPRPVQGGITPEEFMTQQYFESLAKREEYANIAEQMRSGEVLKEMAKFDIQPMVNGQFNDAKVRDFLNLYAKGQPAITPQEPVTTTPTVDYVQVGESITNMNQAMAVLAQDKQLRDQGREGHPLAKEANEFFNSVYSKHNGREKKEGLTLDQRLHKL